VFAGHGEHGYLLLLVVAVCDLAGVFLVEFEARGVLGVDFRSFLVATVVGGFGRFLCVEYARMLDRFMVSGSSVVLG
jgi:hypothetical protein